MYMYDYYSLGTDHLTWGEANVSPIELFFLAISKDNIYHEVCDKSLFLSQILPTPRTDNRTIRLLFSHEIYIPSKKVPQLQLNEITMFGLLSIAQFSA